MDRPIRLSIGHKVVVTLGVAMTLCGVGAIACCVYGVCFSVRFVLGVMDSRLDVASGDMVMALAFSSGALALVRIAQLLQRSITRTVHGSTDAELRSDFSEVIANKGE